MADIDLEFKSKEEFAQVCRALAGRMHHLNRVAMGEQAFAWAVAEMLKDLGRVFEAHYDDPEVRAAFGDGWEPGTLSRDERAPALLALMQRPRS